MTSPGDLRAENAMAAAEFFDRLTADMAKSGGRARLRREQMWPSDIPVSTRRARKYEAETKQMRRFLREQETRETRTA